ncbi:LTA synthase family protein [Lactococcus termiticola]|nr:LTA synthase family protein [Lactococcus termiticola]
MLAYFLVFKGLHSENLADYLLMIVNPLGFTAFFLATSLFIKRSQLFYLATLIWNLLGSLLVYGNVLYFREFSDYLSINTISGGAGMVGKGFALDSIPVHLYDLAFWIDIIIVVVLFAFKKIKMDDRHIGAFQAFKYFSVSLMVFGLTFWGGDMTEHRLVSRQAQYDDTYVVRYLGLGPWLFTNGWYTHVANQTRALASKSDFTKVQEYIKADRYLAPNASTFGIAKNRNVIMIHLESFQQDLIDLKINGQEVTPFLNSLYNNKGTGGSVYAFSNFFNQVGQGKTSDAENMLETSTFGLSTGSLFTQSGSTQTFQAMPAILKQNEGYSSAVFHGNVGSFYNRINVYRNMGYQNFFDQSFFEPNSQNSTAWGVKDKYLFADSIPYLEQLQQPFYTKYLTVSNHTPYTGIEPDEQDPKFKTTNTGNALVDNYFVTAHYLDQSVQEFFNYLKKSGLYDKSVIVLYGDHYGVSGADTKYFAQALGKDPENWTDFDNTMLQRVPFMVDIPGHTDGKISSEYAGEIDVMPTLEHLLGISTNNYIQFGQDLLAKNRQSFVALRNRGFVTPSITKASATDNVYYDTKTGQPITLNEQQKAYVKSVQEKVNTLLDMSDTLNTGDLLRFYTPAGFKPVDAGDYSYTKSATNKRLTKEQEDLKAKSTSLLSENHGISTQSLFETNEPILKDQLSKLAQEKITQNAGTATSSATAPSSTTKK